MELPDDPEILEDAYATPLTAPTDEHYARFNAICKELTTLEFNMLTATSIMNTQEEMGILKELAALDKNPV